MVRCFGADVGVVLDDFDVSPGGGLRLGREAADVLQTAIFEDLNKSSTIGLSDKPKFASIGGSPT